MFSQSRFQPERVQPDRFFRPAVSLGITDWCLEDQVDCWLLFSSSLAFFKKNFLLNLRLRGCLFLAWNTSIIIGGIAIKFCSYGSQRMNPTDLITDSKKKKKRRKKEKVGQEHFARCLLLAWLQTLARMPFLPSPRRLYFHPCLNFLSVGWLVCQQDCTQTAELTFHETWASDGFSVQNRPQSHLVWIWIKG